MTLISIARHPNCPANDRRFLVLHTLPYFVNIIGFLCAGVAENGGSSESFQAEFETAANGLAGHVIWVQGRSYCRVRCCVPPHRYGIVPLIVLPEGASTGVLL